MAGAPDEIPVLRLVVKHPHTQQRTDTAAQQRQQEQRLFRHPPFALSGPTLVRTIHEKCHQIDKYQIDQQRRTAAGGKHRHRSVRAADKAQRRLAHLASLASSQAVAVASFALLYTS